MPLEESTARRRGFVNGPSVRLADGHAWSLPPRDPARDDPEYDGLLAAVVEAEDQPEALRAGLALTIFLLDRNYMLGPDDLSALLSFPPCHPDLEALQRTVDAFAREAAGGLRRTRVVADVEDEGGICDRIGASPWSRLLTRLRTF